MLPPFGSRPAQGADRPRAPQAQLPPRLPGARAPRRARRTRAPLRFACAAGRAWARGPRRSPGGRRGRPLARGRLVDRPVRAEVRRLPASRSRPGSGSSGGDSPGARATSCRSVAPIELPVRGPGHVPEHLDLGIELDPEALVDPPAPGGHHREHVSGASRSPCSRRSSRAWARSRAPPTASPRQPAAASSCPAVRPSRPAASDPGS